MLSRRTSFPQKKLMANGRPVARLPLVMRAQPRFATSKMENRYMSHSHHNNNNHNITIKNNSLMPCSSSFSRISQSNGRANISSYHSTSMGSVTIKTPFSFQKPALPLKNQNILIKNHKNNIDIENPFALQTRGLKRAFTPQKRYRVREQDRVKKWKIVRGDTVEVIGGKKSDIGKRGKVLKIIRCKNAVVVSGVALKKRARKSSEKVKGGLVIGPGATDISNVMLIDPKLDVKTRVRWSWVEETGEKVRVSKKSGEVIPKPEELFDWIEKRKRARNIVSPKDTPAIIALRRSFKIPQVLQDQGFDRPKAAQSIEN